MFGALTAIAVVISVWQIVKEKTERPMPKNARFDWDAYWTDIRNGIGAMEQVRKRERGGYITTKPAPPNPLELPLDTVVDVERYKHDKELYPHYAEQKRKNGGYRYMQKF